MESRPIIRTECKDPMFKKSTERLFEERGISHEEVRQMAEQIAQSIQLKIQKQGDQTSPASVILDYFETSRLHQQLNTLAKKTDQIPLNLAEIASGLKPIKIAILRELKLKHPEIHWYELVGPLQTTEKTRFKRLSDGHIMKELPSFLDEANHRALDLLYQLKEKSPFIAYHHKTRDVDSRLEVSKEIPISNLEERIKSKLKPPFEKTIQQYLDNVRGVDFLIQQGFAISDLSLDNLGIDTVTERGILFDLDTLTKQTEVDDSFYLTKEELGYIPPEVTSPTYKKRIPGRKKREPQSVFELGIALSYVLKAYEETPSAKSDLFLMAKLISEAMLSQNPIDRPQILTVIHGLETYQSESTKIMHPNTAN